MLKLSKIEVIYAKSFFFWKENAGDGDFLSQLFSVDGAFEWFAGPWSACNGSCEDRDVFVFRQRQVGQGITEHQKDQGNACNFRWFQHQFLQKLVDV